MKKGKSNTTGLLIMLVLVVTIFYLITKLQDPKVIKVPVPTPMIPPRGLSRVCVAHLNIEILLLRCTNLETFNRWVFF